jgi:hypothetical protein
MNSLEEEIEAIETLPSDNDSCFFLFSCLPNHRRNIKWIAATVLRDNRGDQLLKLFKICSSYFLTDT